MRRALLTPAGALCTPCVFCTPISGCFKETEDRSAEMLPGSERDVEGGMRRQKRRGAEVLRRR